MGELYFAYIVDMQLAAVTFFAVMLKSNEAPD